MGGREGMYVCKHLFFKWEICRITCNRNLCFTVSNCRNGRDGKMPLPTMTATRRAKGTMLAVAAFLGPLQQSKRRLVHQNRS